MERLDIEKLRQELKCGIFSNDIIYNETVTSTNLIAKELAIEGFKEGTLVIAEAQTSGRGRLGRAWESPEGKGIWMSFILKPDILALDASFITLLAAYSCAEAFEEVTNIRPGIKWPNDIIYNSSKVCGILTEMSAQADKVNFLIVGIGINVNNESNDFSENIRCKATSLREVFGNNISREDVIYKVLKNFNDIYNKALRSDFDKNFKRIFLEEYKVYSITLGSFVRVIRQYSTKLGNEMEPEKGMEEEGMDEVGKWSKIEGMAVNITEEGELVIIKNDGKEERINSGEVSVRGLNGYI